MTAKNPQKQGRILGGGEYFSGWPEYISLPMVDINEYRDIELFGNNFVAF